jgi:hypothetical protein
MMISSNTDDVQRGREVRAAPPERRAHEHHRRHPRVRTDQAAECEQHVAGERRRDDRAECLGEREREAELVGREHEKGAGDDHEQRHGEVRPEQEPVQHPEHPELLGNGLDAPRWCLVAHSAPFAGMIRIRFDGCDLSP